MSQEKRKPLGVLTFSPESEPEVSELVPPTKAELFEVGAQTVLAVGDADCDQAQRAAVLSQGRIPNYVGIIEAGLKRHAYKVVENAEGVQPLRDVSPEFSGVETYGENVIMWEVVASRMQKKAEEREPLVLPEGHMAEIIPIETALTKPGKHKVWELVESPGPTHRVQTLRVMKRSSLPEGHMAKIISFPQPLQRKKAA